MRRKDLPNLVFLQAVAWCLVCVVCLVFLVRDGPEGGMGGSVDLVSSHIASRTHLILPTRPGPARALFTALTRAIADGVEAYRSHFLIPALIHQQHTRRRRCPARKLSRAPDKGTAELSRTKKLLTTRNAYIAAHGLQSMEWIHCAC
jgi:hypothetical protein